MIWPDKPTTKCTNERCCLSSAPELQAEDRAIMPRHLPEDNRLRTLIAKPSLHIAHDSANVAPERAEFDTVQHACLSVGFKKGSRDLPKRRDECGQTASQAARPFGNPCSLRRFGNFQEVGGRVREASSVRCRSRFIEFPDCSNQMQCRYSSILRRSTSVLGSGDI